MRERIRSPRSSGGLQGSDGLGAAHLAGLGAVRSAARPGGTNRRTDRQTDGRIAASLNAPLRREHNNSSALSDLSLRRSSMAQVLTRDHTCHTHVFSQEMFHMQAYTRS